MHVQRNTLADLAYGRIAPTAMLLCILVIAMGASVGCSSRSMYQGNINVSMSEQMKGDSWAYPSYEVDLVAVSDTDKDRWQNYPVEQYFEPGNTFRANAQKYTMKFSNDDAKPKVLDKDNDIWGEWKQRDAYTLFVIANLPGVWAAKPGKEDPRRLVLPLTKEAWPSSWNPFATNVIHLEAKPTGMLVVPAKKDD